MKKLTLNIFLACLVFLLACSSVKEIPMTAEFSTNNRFSEINKHTLGDYLISFLDYRAYENKVINIFSADSTINAGILAPEHWIRMDKMNAAMLFGTDSLKSRIAYNLVTLTNYQKHRSVLSDIILKDPKSSTYDETDMYRIYTNVSGTIINSLCEDSVRFSFESPQDPELTKGKLQIGKDCFLIRPFIRSNPAAPVVLTGIELVKDSVVYAAMQRFPDNIYKRNKIFLYNKVTALEESVIAAYFAILGTYL